MLHIYKSKPVFNNFGSSLPTLTQRIYGSMGFSFDQMKGQFRLQGVEKNALTTFSRSVDQF